MTNWFVEVLTSAVRPAVTIIFTAVVAQAVVEGISMPEWFLYGLAMPCILSWFGYRTIKHLRERKYDL